MATELSKAYPMDSKMTDVASAPAAATNTPAKFEVPSTISGGKNKKNKNNKKNSKKRKYHGGSIMDDMKNQEQKNDMKNQEQKDKNVDMTGGNNDNMKNQNNDDTKNQEQKDKNVESKSFFSGWFGGKSKKRKGKKDKKKRKSARKH